MGAVRMVRMDLAMATHKGQVAEAELTLLVGRSALVPIRVS